MNVFTWKIYIKHMGILVIDDMIEKKEIFRKGRNLSREEEFQRTRKSHLTIT